MYSHRYSLFMELTSMFTVFMISDAFLFSFILLLKKKTQKFEVAILINYSEIQIALVLTWQEDCLRALNW